MRRPVHDGQDMYHSLLTLHIHATLPVSPVAAAPTRTARGPAALCRNVVAVVAVGQWSAGDA